MISNFTTNNPSCLFHIYEINTIKYLAFNKSEEILNECISNKGLEYLDIYNHFTNNGQIIYSGPLNQHDFAYEIGTHIKDASKNRFISIYSYKSIHFEKIYLNSGIYRGKLIINRKKI